MTCDVCKRTDAAMTAKVGEHSVCMNCCNPFRRCPNCLGVFQTAPTPNDMGRQQCDRCGKTRRR